MEKEERLLWGKTYLITILEEIFTLKSYLWCTTSNLRLLHQKVQQQKLFSVKYFISYTIIITSFYPIDSPLISFLEKESSLLCRIANLMFFEILQPLYKSKSNSFQFWKRDKLFSLFFSDICRFLSGSQRVWHIERH